MQGLRALLQSQPLDEASATAARGSEVRLGASLPDAGLLGLLWAYFAVLCWMCPWCPATEDPSM